MTHTKSCDEFTTCVCLKISGLCLIVGFSFVVGPIVAVMVKSFALPFHIFESLCFTKKGE